MPEFHHSHTEKGKATSTKTHMHTHMVEFQKNSFAGSEIIHLDHTSYPEMVEGTVAVLTRLCKMMKEVCRSAD